MRFAKAATKGRMGVTVPYAVGYALALGLACWVSYSLTTKGLARLTSVGHENDLLGGMWAVIATVFVFRVGYRDSVEAAASRGVSTLVSFALCLVWLRVLAPGVTGLLVVISVGTAVLLLAGRADDVVTTGVTSAVVMVVASLGPVDQAWTQPLLRLGDTAIGVLIGLGAAWVLHRLALPATRSRQPAVPSAAESWSAEPWSAEP
jgi:uncharacterized membrane protein YccC